MYRLDASQKRKIAAALSAKIALDRAIKAEAALKWKHRAVLGRIASSEDRVDRLKEEAKVAANKARGGIDHACYVAMESAETAYRDTISNINGMEDVDAAKLRLAHAAEKYKADVAAIRSAYYTHAEIIEVKEEE